MVSLLHERQDVEFTLGQISLSATETPASN
jgi:hypothetical protein